MDSDSLLLSIYPRSLGQKGLGEDRKGRLASTSKAAGRHAEGAIGSRGSATSAPHFSPLLLALDVLFMSPPPRSPSKGRAWGPCSKLLNQFCSLFGFKWWVIMFCFALFQTPLLQMDPQILRPSVTIQ